MSYENHVEHVRLKVTAKKTAMYKTDVHGASFHEEICAPINQLSIIRLHGNDITSAGTSSLANYAMFNVKGALIEACARLMTTYKQSKKEH